MHKNDLKSPSYFTYSSLTARKSEMINWNWDFQFHNSARITHEFWTFQQPAWNLCFFYECWIDLAAGSWLTSQAECADIPTYLLYHTYTYLVPTLCTLQNTSISLHYPGLITEYFISWTLLYTSITQHYWVVVTYNFSSINFNWDWLQFTYVLFIHLNIPDCCHISLEFNIKGSASHVVVELPLNLKIISGMIRQHSIDSIRAFPTAAQCGQSRDPENPENKH